MCLLGKSRIRQKYYLSAFDNPTKQVMVIYNSSIKVLILMTIYEELDHIWFRIDTKFISFLYECLRQKFYSFEIFSLIALSIRAWLTISHIQQELTLPFIQKHTSFKWYFCGLLFASEGIKYIISCMFSMIITMGWKVFNSISMTSSFLFGM